MKTVSSLLAMTITAISFNVTAASAFRISSTDITDNLQLTQKQIFNGFGCNGENISPQLSWQNPPAGTKSYAITLFDPDAPTGSGWWHWTVVNIPAHVQTLPSGVGKDKLPAGAIQGRNDFGYSGFGGACPPAGDKPHRYQFTVWALNTEMLPIDSNASGALVGFMLNSHVIAKAELTATYGR
ncbi:MULTISPECIES: kinase inhibitor [Citrobacter]|uniref:kinase inhibitor n=1 Tax=Citrobacter sp. S-77 TaxID=1080067 RepID=UPI0005F086D2|nr:kinase inhibitor [Citrobacter sp. S-77]MCQ7060560.1 kinase inhibitor [Escherichia coli]